MPEERLVAAATDVIGGAPVSGPPSEGCSWPEPPSLPKFTGAVLMCPVCVSTVDAVSWGWQQHTCGTCGTEFAVDLRPDVVAEHAMMG